MKAECIIFLITQCLYKLQLRSHDFLIDVGTGAEYYHVVLGYQLYYLYVIYFLCFDITHMSLQCSHVKDASI